MYLKRESDLLLREPDLVNSDLGVAIDWMKSVLGINILPTRIAFYEKYLVSKSKIESLEDYRKYILISKEVDDFLRVSNVFREYSNKELFEKIRKISSGKKYREDILKSSEDPSRDFLHELSVASKFMKAGFDVDVSGDCDVVVKAYEKTVYIECKRIKSESKVTKRVKNANKQIERRIGASKKNKIGYIAIDVTDLIITGRPIKVHKNFSDFKQYTLQELKLFIQKYREKVKGIASKRVLGVIFSVSNIGLIQHQSEERDKIINCHTAYVVGCESGGMDFLFNSKVLGRLV